MTGLDGEPSPDTPWSHSRRGASHRLRGPGREERRQVMLQAIPVSSHACTVPRPASLESDSTATSPHVVDGSNAEGRHHRFRWTTIHSLDMLGQLAGHLSLREGPFPRVSVSDLDALNWRVCVCVSVCVSVPVSVSVCARACVCVCVWGGGGVEVGEYF